MGMTWRYDAEANIVFSEANGVVAVPEMLEYLRAVVADERIQPGFLEVTTFEHGELDMAYVATPTPGSSSQLTTFAATWEGLRHRHGSLEVQRCSRDFC